MKADNKPQPRKAKTKIVTFDDFVPTFSPDLDPVDRAARFLDWAAIHMPRRFVPYGWIAKHANGMRRKCSPESNEVATIRKKLGAIKRILWNEFGRRTCPAPHDQELGLRASTDDDDIAGTDYLRNKRRIYNGIQRLRDTRSKIDPARMRDPNLKSMVQNMDPILKKLTDDKLMNSLMALPPRSTNDSDD